MNGPADSRRNLAPGLALIFDMDGVLMDSNPAHREAWVAYNRSCGLETTGAMLERMYGRRNDEIVRDYFGEHLSPEEVQARGAAKERLYREMIAGRVEGMLLAGLRPFLEAYRGAPMAVASNAEPENVSFLLDQAGLRPYFRVVLDGHQVSRPSRTRRSICLPRTSWEFYRRIVLFLKILIPGWRRRGRRG